MGAHRPIGCLKLGQFSSIQSAGFPGFCCEIEGKTMSSPTHLYAKYRHTVPQYIRERAAGLVDSVVLVMSGRSV
jgi:hypothetical protein